MRRIDRRRAVIVFALGTDTARDLIGYATRMYGDESFAIDRIHRLIREWADEQLTPSAQAIRDVRQLIDDLSARASAYEDELRAIHDRELEQAIRKGWK